MCDGLILIRQATADGYIAMCNGGVCDLSYPTSKLRRGRVQGGWYDLPNNNKQLRRAIQDNGVLCVNGY